MKVATSYFVLAGAYILASSLPLGGAFVAPKHHALVETLKGLAFVTVTAVALGIILHRDYVALVDARSKLAASATALARAQSAASLSVVTGAIAHDMRNLLSSAITNLDFVGEPAGPEGAEAMRDVRDALHRIAEFARNLLERSGKPSLYPPTEVDIAEVVTSCVRLTSLFVRDHQCAFLTTAGEGCVARVRRQEIECAVLNLLLNAIDASERQGTITVSVMRVEGAVVLRVRDQGPGVPEALREKIFEPFFTTKGEHGNGVGLAVTRALARSFGGDVRLVGAHDGGAEFELRLPSK